jgi:hypothetical protein
LSKSSSEQTSTAAARVSHERLASSRTCAATLVARGLVDLRVAGVDVLRYAGRRRRSCAYGPQLGRGYETAGREVGEVVLGSPASRLRRLRVVHIRDEVRFLFLAAGLHQVSKLVFERHAYGPP